MPAVRWILLCCGLYIAAARIGGATRPPATFRLFGAELPTRGPGVTSPPHAAVTHAHPALPGGIANAAPTGFRLFGADIAQPSGRPEPPVRSSHSSSSTSSLRLSPSRAAGEGSAVSPGASHTALTSGHTSDTPSASASPAAGAALASSSSAPIARPSRGILATHLAPDDELLGRLRQWGVSVSPDATLEFSNREGAPRSFGELAKALLGDKYRDGWSRSVSLRLTVAEVLARQRSDGGGELLERIREQRQGKLDQHRKFTEKVYHDEQRRLRQRQVRALWRQNNAELLRERDRQYYRARKERARSGQNAAEGDGEPRQG